MIDQAAALRDLVRQCERDSAPAATHRMTRILFVGGKGGVGTTTIAVHTTLALRAAGRRPLLIDADLYRADTLLLCGLDPSALQPTGSVRAALKDSIQIGAGGIRVLPSIWPPGRPITLTESSWRRLNDQIDGLAPHTDLAVFDSGGSYGEIRRRLWRSADAVVLVTRPDDLSVMDAYATVKSMHQAGLLLPSQSLGLVVNLAGSDAQAADVYERIARSCRRFLETSLADLGHVLRDDELERPMPKAAVPMGDSPFNRIAERLIEPLRSERLAEPADDPIPTDTVPPDRQVEAA